MTATLARFQPSVQDLEIESLLLEMLNDPRSRLLRATRAQAALTRLEWDPRVSSTAPGLTKAERRLLEGYREEAALLLRRYYLECFLRDACPTGIRVAPRGEGGDGRRDDPELLRESLVRVEKALHSGFLGQGRATEVLESVSHGLSRSVSPTEILTSCVRLWDDGTARLYLAVEVLRQGRGRDALTIARRVEATATRRSAGLGAATVAGLVHTSSGRFDLALEIYETGARLGSDWPDEHLAWFTTSIQTEDFDRAHEAARRIDERWSDPDDEVIQAWVAERLRERADGVWSPTAASKRVLRSLRGRLGATSGAIASVF